MKPYNVFTALKAEKILREVESAESKMGNLLIKLLAHDETTPEQIAEAVAMTKRVSASMEAIRASTHRLTRRN